MKFSPAIPDAFTLPATVVREFGIFLQRITNRLAVGHVRYGPPAAKRQYMSRLTAELKEYKKSGNTESLLNIAVYCFLEIFAPENKKSHYDPGVDSVTRKKFGGG